MEHLVRHRPVVGKILLCDAAPDAHPNQRPFVLGSANSITLPFGIDIDPHPHSGKFAKVRRHRPGAGFHPFQQLFVRGGKPIARYMNVYIAGADVNKRRCLINGDARPRRRRIGDHEQQHHAAGHARKEECR